MLPGRLSRRASSLSALSSPALPARRPAFSTLSSSRRALNLSPVLAYPRSSPGRHLSQGVNLRQEHGRSLDEKGTTTSSSAASRRLPRSKPPPAWSEENVSVPQTVENLLSDARSTSSEVAEATEASASDDSSSPSSSTDSALSPTPEVQSLESLLQSLPSESSLETLKATVISSLLYGGVSVSSPCNSAGTELEEPVIGLYCPLEDSGVTSTNSIKEVVARLGGDLVVLDAVELCAEGEGALGPATSVITLSPNPLKIRSFTSNNVATSYSSGSGFGTSRFEQEEMDEDEEDEEDDHFDAEEEEDDYDEVEPSLNIDQVGKGSHSVGASESTRNSKPWSKPKESTPEDKVAGELPTLPSSAGSPSTALVPSVRPRHSLAFQLRETEQLNSLNALFSGVVNASSSATTSAALPSTAPRIIFVKDAHLMSSTWSNSSTWPKWFDALKTAVQSRRASGQPTNIVLGLGPSILEPLADVPPPTPAALPPGMEEMMPPSYLERQAERINNFVPYRAFEGTVQEAPFEDLVKEKNPGAFEKDLWIKKRLETMAGGRWGALVPAFESTSKNGGPAGSSSTSPLQLLQSRLQSLGSGGGLGGGAVPFGLPGLSQAISKGNVAVLEVHGNGNPFMPSSDFKNLFSGRPQEGGASNNSNSPKKTIWKMVGIYPRARTDEHRKEALLARIRQRLQINNLLLSMALSNGRGYFVDGLKKVQADLEKRLAGRESESEKKGEKDVKKVETEQADEVLEHVLATSILPWDRVVKLAGDAVGVALSERFPQIWALRQATSLPSTSATDDIPDTTPSSPLSDSPELSSKPRPKSPFLTSHRLPVTWSQLVQVAKLEAETQSEYKRLIKDLNAGKSSSSSGSAGGKDGPAAADKDKEEEPDQVVEDLKKDQTLNKYEKKVLSTIVDRRGLREGFDDVHLPEKTIDAIRSVVSLPLLFPEAFSTGILKNHATSGALLFGPPGTGKTLVVRALAKESGARMMSIQPSDVMDMYFGEAEKLVKAVFSVARKLSPCIVFIDELDALFEARSGGSKGGGDSARRQMLTEFMQEMDGLSSAAKNKDRGLIVIGATNRPQDLDEAVLRRLPRRLMIDLPAEKEREAILQLLLKSETLAPDVDLAKLAKDTATFSGSDLKHLCVMAAQEAIKEQYTLPWAARQAADRVSAGDSSTPAPSPSPSKPAKSPIDIPVTPEAEAEAVPEQPQVVPSKPAPVQDASGTDQPTVTRVLLAEGGELPSLSSLPDVHEAPTAAQLVPSATAPKSHPPSDQAAPLTPPETTNANPADSDSSSPPSSPSGPSTPLSTEPKLRVLTKAHFEYALKNSSSSGSEELGALPELRKWNEQFGDAGTKKNKRSGFGKGFGFGERETKK